MFLKLTKTYSKYYKVQYNQPSRKIPSQCELSKCYSRDSTTFRVRAKVGLWDYLTPDRRPLSIFQ